jgi:hypothetical protein
MKYIVLLLTTFLMQFALADDLPEPTDKPPCIPGDTCPEPCEPYPECAIWPNMTVGDVLDIKYCADKGEMMVKAITIWHTQITACAKVKLTKDDPPRDGTLKGYRSYCLRHGGQWVGNDINGYCVGI